MNLESEHNQSLEKQMASCPIHQWADIDGYLEEAQVPEYLRTPLHELIIARGKYPKVMRNDQGKLFAAQAVNITAMYEILPTEGQALRLIFGQLIGQWLSAESFNN